MPISSNTEKPSRPSVRPPAGPGREGCPICGGIGYLRDNVPLGDPRFGEVTPCVCMQGVLQAQASERLYRFSHLERLRNMTFDAFSPRGRVALSRIAQESLERAYNLASNFAQSRKGWLLLEGGFGCGKTHLAAAIANHCVDQGVPTLFLTAPDLLDWLRASFETADDRFSERFDEIRTVPLLVVDDFGTQNATPWAQEKLFQLLDDRYLNNLPTVLTTNLRLEEIEGRIRSRLADTERVHRVHIQAPDYRRPDQEWGSTELSTLYLHARQTFASFAPRAGEHLTAEEAKSLKVALEYAHRMAESPAGWLVLLGPFGCGKTHLAAAIANHREALGYPALFVVVPDLLDYLRAAFNPSSPVSYDRLFEEIRSANLLVLDDLGAQNTTPWAREKLFQLINHRYNAELVTIITSSMSVDELDPRIRTRLLDRRLCTICGITAPPYVGEKGGSAPRPTAGSPRKTKRMRQE